MKQAVHVLTMLLAGGAAVWAQGQGGGRGASSNPALSLSDTQSPVYISGSVIMADGSPTPKETVVELMCGGFPRASESVTPKGEFDIDLSGSSEGVIDATRANSRTSGLPQRNALGVVNLSGCVVRAELPGYRSTEIALGMNSIFDDPNIGEIVLTRLEGLTGDTVSATSGAAPKNAAKLFEKAVKESRNDDAKHEKMVGWLEEAVREYPQFAAAWNLLGQTRLAVGDNGGALQAFEGAIAADPKFIAPYPHLVKLVAASGDLERTIELGSTALKLNPHLEETRFFVCAAQLKAGKNQDAIATAHQMIERGEDQRFPQAHQLLGAATANTGDYAAAAKHFRKFLELDPDATAAGAIRNQLKEWESLGVIPAAAATP